MSYIGLPWWLRSKESACNAGAAGDVSRFLGQEDSLEESMATHSSILAWKISWTEGTGRPQSIGCTELDITEEALTPTHAYYIYNMHMHMLSHVQLLPQKNLTFLENQFFFFFKRIFFFPGSQGGLQQIKGFLFLYSTTVGCQLPQGFAASGTMTLPTFVELPQELAAQPPTPREACYHASVCVRVFCNVDLLSTR